MQDALALIGFAAALYFLGQLAERLLCPALLGELLAGVLLGPHGLALLSADMAAALKVAGEVGLLLMVLDGGLAMELDVLRTQGVRAVVLALTGTALPVLLGWATMVMPPAGPQGSAAAPGGPTTCELG